VFVYGWNAGGRRIRDEEGYFYGMGSDSENLIGVGDLQTTDPEFLDCLRQHMPGLASDKDKKKGLGAALYMAGPLAAYVETRGEKFCTFSPKAGYQHDRTPDADAAWESLEKHNIAHVWSEEEKTRGKITFDYLVDTKNIRDEIEEALEELVAHFPGEINIQAGKFKDEEITVEIEITDARAWAVEAQILDADRAADMEDIAVYSGQTAEVVVPVSGTVKDGKIEEFTVKKDKDGYAYVMAEVDAEIDAVPVTNFMELKSVKDSELVAYLNPNSFRPGWVSRDRIRGQRENAGGFVPPPPGVFKKIDFTDTPGRWIERICSSCVRAFADNKTGRRSERAEGIAAWCALLVEAIDQNKTIPLSVISRVSSQVRDFLGHDEKQLVMGFAKDNPGADPKDLREFRRDVVSLDRDAKDWEEFYTEGW
jgi:hypothetical protein